MIQRQSIKNALRFLAIGVLAIVALVFLIFGLFITQRLHQNNYDTVIAGVLNLTDIKSLETPVYLNGQWESFDGILCQGPGDVESLGESSGYTQFPIATLVQAEKAATYRLRFTVPADYQEDLVLAIPTFDGQMNIFFNGQQVRPQQGNSGWISVDKLEYRVDLTNLRPGEQELVLSGDFTKQGSTLYKRAVLLGDVDSISTFVVFDSASEMFLLGILLLVLVNGYVFMIYRPGHKIISMITLFDSMVLMRVLASMNYVMAFCKEIFPGMVITDRFRLATQLFFLMLGGLFGCLLSTALYDPKRRAPRWLLEPIPYIYGFFAIVFPLFIGFFEQFGSMILNIVYLITFIGVFLEFKICWRNTNKRYYYLFQFIKTLYVGTVVFFDIFNWTRFVDISILYYMYAIFFIMHVVVRLYDNNQSYREVELLNQGLESTVEERTRELSRANQILSELSIRDPLTNTFNRLYFEGALERVFASSDNLHLCMFDLDFFKRVNDTYGHDVGDELLCTVVNIVEEKTQDMATLARVGGEEFVLLFENKTHAQVLECVEEVRRALNENAKKNTKHTTASFGVAALKERDTTKSLMKRADLALYQAKNSGRNTVVCEWLQPLRAEME